MPEEPTNLERFERFITYRWALMPDGRKNVPVCEAWLKIPTTLLAMPIPADAVKRIHGDAVELTLNDFTLNVVELGEDSIIALSANYKLNPERSRYLPTTADDVADWMDIAEQLGFTDDDLLTMVERQALLPESGM